MPVQFDIFSQGKIDNLKTHLEATAAKGKPKSFEIWVDGLQVIPRTEEPAEFDNYEEYLRADSHEIKVVIYCGDKTPRNDKYIFQLKAKNPQEAIDMGIAGLPVKTFNSREIDQWRQKNGIKTEQNRELENLRDELDEATELVAEKQKYIEELEEKIQEAKANGNKIGGVDLGQAITSGLEGLLRNSTKFIAQVPGLAGIAELIDADTKSRQTNTPHLPEAEVTVKRRESMGEGIILTDQEKELLAFFKQIQRHFSQSEFEQVVNILDLLSKDKTELDIVLSHLRGEDQEEESQTK